MNRITAERSPSHLLMTCFLSLGWLFFFLVMLTACPPALDPEKNTEVIADRAVSDGSEGVTGSESGAEANDEGPGSETPAQDAGPDASGRPDDVPLTREYLLMEDGDRQRGEINKPLLRPIVVRYIDKLQQGVADVEIEFTVIAGGGTVDGAATRTIKTDKDGRASVLWTLGDIEGFQQQRITAQKKGDASLPLTFTAAGFEAGPPEQTRFAGVVINNQAQPLPGISVFLVNNNKKSAVVKTDINGRFLLSGLQDFVGQAHLVIQGGTEPSADVYPQLEYDVFNIAGIENRLDGPVPLPKLDPTGTVQIDAAKTTEVKPTSMQGFQMTIAAGSALFSDKTKSGTLNVTKVDPYWIPMAPPSGYAATSVVTIQPSDVRFDPPAPISFPNTDNAPAGKIVPIFTFDHGKGRYVEVARGQVSADGKSIRSLPGQGVVQGGWHLAAQIAPQRTTVDDCTKRKASVTFSRHRETPASPCPEKDRGPSTRTKTEADPEQGKGVSKSEGDPVLLHSGAFAASYVDLEVPGRGLSFRWARRYHSRITYHGPLGHSWDHSYNQRLSREANGDVIISHGLGRADRFVFDAQKKTYQAPAQLFAELSRLPNGNYVLKWPKGRLDTFDHHGVLVSMRDRVGNEMTFAYNLKAQLSLITDPLGRHYQISYNGNGHIAEVRDFIGRKIRYGYDEHDRLESITTPATARFPKGKTTQYTYDTDLVDLSKAYNLLTMTDPKGQVFLTNKYNADDRVIEQTYGPGIYTFAYQKVNAGASPTDLSIVRMMTTVTDPSKNVVKHHFNIQGNPLKTEQLSRKLRPTDPAAWVTSMTFNANGWPTQVTYPNGNSLTLTYDTTNADRLAHNNVLSMLWTSHLASDKHKTLLVTMTYEPRYQLRKTYTDPRGTCAGCDAKKYTTTYFYDYEEAQAGDLNGDGKTNETSGNVVKIERPTATLPDGKAQPRAMTITYNAFGQPASRTDALGIVTEYDYYTSNSNANDPSDREGYLRHTIFDAKGLKLTSKLAYDLVGNITTYTNPRGHTWRFHYNPRNQRLVSIAPAPFDYKTFYEYDANDNLIEGRYENILHTGKLDLDHPYLITRYKYNILNKRIERSQEASPGKSLITTWERDALQRPTKLIQPAGNARCVMYDERSYLLTSVEGCGAPNAATTTYTYDKNGNLTLVQRPEGEEYKRTFDGYNRLQQVIDPLGASVMFEYDRQGNRVSTLRRGSHGGQSDVLLGQVDRVFDEANRRIERISHLFASPGSAVTKHKRSYFYDAGNGLVRKVDRRGNAWIYGYDSAHRLVSVTGPEGNRTSYTLDTLGLTTRIERNVLGTTGSIAAKTYFRTYTYDALNRRTQSTNHLGHIRKYGFDSRGNLREYTDPMGEVTRYQVDGVDRIIEQLKILRKAGAVTGQISRSFRWDDNSRMIAQIDDHKNVTSYEYDALNRPTSLTYPPATKGGTQRKRLWTYDKNGRVVTQTDPSGTVRTYTFNKASRITKVALQLATGVGGITSLDYTYDGRYRITQVKNDHTTVQFAYDSWSRRSSETLNGKATIATYDLSGNRLSLQYPNGTQLSYTHDKRHRLRTINAQGQSKALASYQYLGNQVLHKDHQNGNLMRRNVDAIGRILEHQTTDAQRKTLTGFGFRYNDAGHRVYKKALHRSGAAQVFSWDSLYRLIGVGYDIADPDQELATPGSQTASRRVSYSLDGVGNRTSSTDGTNTSVFTTNGRNQYDKIGSQTLVYDANGNLQDDGTNLYSYDYANRLLNIRQKQGNALVASYRYGPLGRRVEKVVGSATTRYYFDRARVLEERDGSDKVNAHYTYGRRIDERLTMERNGKAYTYQHNLVGSVVGMTDAAGAMVERVRYDAFGQPSLYDPQDKAISASASGNPYYFTGRRLDDESKLYHYRSRTYQPAWGRFLQRDPKGTIDGPNLYAYARGNPISFVDPYGTNTSMDGRNYNHDALRSSDDDFNAHKKYGGVGGTGSARDKAKMARATAQAKLANAFALLFDDKKIERAVFEGTAVLGERLLSDSDDKPTTGGSTKRRSLNDILWITSFQSMVMGEQTNRRISTELANEALEADRLEYAKARGYKSYEDLEYAIEMETYTGKLVGDAARQASPGRKEGLASQEGQTPPPDPPAPGAKDDRGNIWKKKREKRYDLTRREPPPGYDDEDDPFELGDGESIL